MTNPETQRSTAHSGSPDEGYLAARYGATSPPRRRRTLLIVTAAVAVAAFAGWLAWGGLLGGTSDFEATTQGHTRVSDTELEVRWQFTVAPGTSARCAVEALDDTYGVIGWKIIDVPASTERSRVLSETVRTTAPASSGLIYRCWLT